ncbi:MAG TPA: response regulator [Polyangiaceae bacterium]|jgi:two-component system chemotaxis response regulator CheY|nr:response regulator [Polyangiaceae bacterium]
MPPSILVIDDSTMVRKQVGTALKAQGYTVVEAVDGVDALSKLEAHPETRLVVCDVNMPRMNGLEFLEQLSARKHSLPVVMLTTEGQPELIQRAKALGAVGWLVKPFKPEFLLATAKKLAPTGT